MTTRFLVVAWFSVGYFKRVSQDAKNVSGFPLVIVKVGSSFPELAREMGDFEDWIAAGLGIPVVIVDPRVGDLPERVAGAIVTGSHAMVTDRADWSERTAVWLAGLVSKQVPVLGICYGHQLLADALGGEVIYHPGGMEIGTVGVELLPEARADRLFRHLPDSFPAQVIHGQSVRRLPKGAVHLAANSFEPHHAFRVGPCAWGVQFHPEFDDCAMRGYVDHMAAELTDAQAIAAAIRPTPESASLLPAFAAIVAERA